MIEQKKILLNYQMPAMLEEIEPLAHAVSRALADYQDCVFPVNLCLDELITNTVSYGLKGAPDRIIQVQIQLSGHELEIQIIDDAPQFDPFLKKPHPDLNASIENRKIGGLGIYFVEKIMSEYHSYYDGRHNITILKKRLHPSV